ncbi:DNA damage-inducible protein 1 [Wickerhamomyces ciferrii]|uniref:DNA damage-inducible protein 1 n=1 Tax=Wickerhamomyces ciferrii (strain ATCC 14091 / BCRC 22168 / CBS 111 / JCM 3599 / NBRC 0793 / NRRL Y-1031 F-60-10) TaxID=1206466 RepID=K0KSV4_WICCF|nr:DNA damage-inducible protein 1 [Wickerhamomyces ciferrii]CCH45132.1 DNA damage-inducible protein 1 [Wickerhamomyces ciferrii]
MVNITATVEDTDQLIPIDISGDLSLLDFKAYISAESDIEPNDQILILNGKELQGDSKTLSQLNFTDNEMLIVRNKNSIKNTPSNSAAISNQSQDAMDQQTEQLRLQLLNNPLARRQITTLNPGIENVLDDPVQFREAVKSTLVQHDQSNYPGGVSQDEWLQLQSDPDNPENQRRILELIEQDQIEENMRNAWELTPESFASVSMLYINVEVNGHPIKAFVDSGAQSTIISTKLAEECNISRLIDRRFRGEARGVGRTEILGRIHSAPLKIEDQFVPCSFTVLDTGVDMLLGLDMLKRHQANIDLKRNVLVIADVETPFLGDAEIPSMFNPSGTIGQQLGGGPLPSSNNQTATATEPPSSLNRPSAANAAANAAVTRNNQTSSSFSAGNHQASRPNFDDAVITNLMGLGFSRDQVIRALDQTGGNAELAASILFS